MSPSNRPLILRSNRFLGSSLLERDLIDNDTLENANEKLLEVIQSGNLKNASLLNVLMFELKALDEGALIDHIIDNEKVGAIDLQNYQLDAVLEMDLDLDLCSATYTLPFDIIEGFHLVATSYYLSRPSVQFWEEKIDGNILWYVSSVSSIINAIEKLRQMRADAAAEAAAKASKTQEKK